MALLALCLSMIFIGYIFGHKIIPKDKEFKWASKVQFTALFILVFVMSTKIGADEKVIDSLGSIGVISFVITVFAMAGSVVAVVFTRKLLKINRKGEREND